MLCADLEKVELVSAHARHALADGRVDGGARDVAVFEYAPFGTAEDSAWWQSLLELPLLAKRISGSEQKRTKVFFLTDKDDLCWAIMIG